VSPVKYELEFYIPEDDILRVVKLRIQVGFEVLRALSVKGTILQYATPCILVETRRLLGGVCSVCLNYRRAD
jgi:hypothetical protein